MPRWGQILEELNRTRPPDFDGVRRRYLDQLHRHTDRTVVLYASGWLQKPGSHRVSRRLTMRISTPSWRLPQELRAIIWT